MSSYALDCIKQRVSAITVYLLGISGCTAFPMFNQSPINDTLLSRMKMKAYQLSLMVYTFVPHYEMEARASNTPSIAIWIPRLS